MLFDLPALAISVLRLLPCMLERKVKSVSPLHRKWAYPQLPAIKAGVPQGFAGRGDLCCLTLQRRCSLFLAIQLSTCAQQQNT